MAFDVTNPTHLAELKSEVNTDPIGMDYASAGTKTRKILDKLNLPENNVESPVPTTGQLTVGDLRTAIDPAEMGANQVDNGSLGYATALLSLPDPNEDLTDWIPQLKSVFANQAPNTLAALNAAFRDVSRAEVLFGIHTDITPTEWAAARDS